MKKIISALLVVVFLFAATVATIPSASAADDGLQFVLTNASGVQNGEFTVDLVIKNNPGIWGFYFCLYYDADTFILRNTEVNSNFSSVGGLAETYDNVEWTTEPGYFYPQERIATNFPLYGASYEDKYTKILYFEANGIEDFDLNGTVLTFTFQVQGIAEDGTYEIGIIPDSEMIINVTPEEVPFTWTNALVSVGTESKVPTETAESKAPDETYASSDVTSSSKDTSAETTAPVETFVGDDGKVYYTNEQGETKEYDPEDFTSPSDLVIGSDDTVEDENGDQTQDIDDIDAEKTSEIEAQESQNRTVLYIVIAVVLVLAAVAVILYVFIFKAKKEETEEKEEHND